MSVTSAKQYIQTLVDAVAPSDTHYAEAWDRVSDELDTYRSLLAEALDSVDTDEEDRAESWPGEVARGELVLDLGIRMRNALDAPAEAKPVGAVDPAAMDELALQWCKERGLVAEPGQKLYLIDELYGGLPEGSTFASFSEEERDAELERLFRDLDPDHFDGLEGDEFWGAVCEHNASTTGTEYHVGEIELPAPVALPPEASHSTHAAVRKADHPSPGNAQRAEWARIALDTFASVAGTGEGEDGITDLMVDLLHLADRQGLDTARLVARATSHFEEEAQSSWLDEWRTRGDDAACPQCGESELETQDGVTECYTCGWQARNALAH
jgi:hypothetical protein